MAAGPSSLRSKIGLESVLRTSLLLASEKDAQGLIKRVLSVLMQVRSQALRIHALITDSFWA